jgi:putative PIN family toxin of toxin-antitoxin system
MRIVLDTNVVLSALLWRGTPYRLFETTVRSRNIQLFTSLVLLDELTEVLGRALPTRRLALIRRTSRDVLADYIDAVELVSPVTTPRVIDADPDDDHVIAAAVAGDAQLIVSGDRHLLALGSHSDIRILSPADALPVLAAVSGES